MKSIFVAVFSMTSSDTRVAKTRRSTGSELTEPEDAEAVFSTTPASTSACVVTSVPVQVIEALGSKPPAGNAGHVTVAIRESETEIGSVKVTLPVLVTSNS